MAILELSKNIYIYVCVYTYTHIYIYIPAHRFVMDFLNKMNDIVANRI